MKCNICGGEWQEPEGFKGVEKCIFCGNIIKREPRTAKWGIEYIARLHGIKTLENSEVCKGIVSDILDAPKDWMLIRNIIDSGAVKILLNAAYETVSEEEKAIVCQKAVKVLIDDLYMEQSKAVMCIDWFANVILKCDAPEEVLNTKAEDSSSKETEQEISETQEFLESNSVEKEPTGSDIQKAEKSDSYEIEKAVSDTHEPVESNSSEEELAVSDIQESITNDSSEKEQAIPDTHESVENNSSEKEQAVPEIQESKESDLPATKQAVSENHKQQENNPIEAKQASSDTQVLQKSDTEKTDKDTPKLKSGCQDSASPDNYKGKADPNSQGSTISKESSKPSEKQPDSKSFVDLAKGFFAKFGFKPSAPQDKRNILSELKEFEKVLKENYGLEMVKCPAGTFMMGSSNKENGRWSDEVQHKVHLTKDFYIGRYPVTQELYMLVTGKNNPSFFAGEGHPVENITWNEAKQFCLLLNKQTEKFRPQNYEFDLPTDAQWEYACRAGTKTTLNSGKEIITAEGLCQNLDEIAWYKGNSGGTTHPVGQKKPNAWGIYDMHGNVWEWCRDWYEKSSPKDAVDPQGPKEGDKHTCRGGNWDCTPRYCRSANRFSCTKEEESYYLPGFRLVLVVKS